METLSNDEEISGRFLYFPPLTIEIGAMRVIADSGNVVAITNIEYKILMLLASVPGKTFTAGQIYAGVWNMPDLEDLRAVRVHIGRLRKKLRAACPEYEFINTVWCEGYFFGKADR